MDTALVYTSRVSVPMTSLDLFIVLNHSSGSLAVGFTQNLSEMSTTNLHGGLERGLRLRLTSLPPIVRRFSTQCGILNISQPYRPPRPVKGIALIYM
jgi:hypothetical protein